MNKSNFNTLNSQILPATLDGGSFLGDYHLLNYHLEGRGQLKEILSIWGPSELNLALKAARWPSRKHKHSLLWLTFHSRTKLNSLSKTVACLAKK